MLYNIILKIAYYELVIESVSVDDFPWIFPIIEKMKLIYIDEEKPFEIILRRVGVPADGEDG